MNARYLLCPGDVQSRTDGQVHYVPALQLVHLYGVQLSDCIILPGNRTPMDRRLREAWLARAAAGEIVALWPREDGDYLGLNTEAEQPARAKDTR
jgi:hypothetical protein